MKVSFLVVLLVNTICSQYAYSQTDKYVSVQLNVTANTKEKQFDTENTVTEKSETAVTYSVNLVLLLSDETLARIIAQKQNFKFCKGRGGCILLNGNNEMSATIAAKTQKQTYGVPYTLKKTVWTKCEDKLVLTGISEASGSLDNNHINTQISALQTPGVNGSFPYYQLFVNIGCGFGHSPITSGTILKGESYACGSSFEPNKYELCASNYRVLEDITTSISSSDFTDTYTPPIFDEAELINFLKGFPGNKFAHSFRLNAKEYHKSKIQEEETEITISLIFLGSWQPTADN